MVVQDDYSSGCFQFFAGWFETVNPSRTVFFEFSPELFFSQQGVVYQQKISKYGGIEGEANLTDTGMLAPMYA